MIVVRDIFTITNKGTQPLGVWVTGGSEAVTFEDSTERSLEGKQQAVSLTPGQSVTVGVTVDTRQQEGDSMIKSVKIHADSDVAGATVEGGSGDSAGHGSESHSANTGPTPANETASSTDSKTNGGTPSVRMTVAVRMSPPTTTGAREQPQWSR